MDALQRLAEAWSFPGLLSVFAVVCAAAYLWRFGWGRGRAWGFLGALGLVVLTAASPLDALAREYLLTAGVLEHTLTLLVAPLFLVAAIPGVDEAAPPARARAAAFAGWTIGMAVLTAWYLPPLYNAALKGGAARAAFHISSVLAGAAFWWPVVGPRKLGRIRPVPAGVWYLFGATAWCSILGLALAFSPLRLYPAYLDPKDSLGLLGVLRDALRLNRAVDQESAGLLLWLASCSVHLSMVMYLFYRWYTSPEVRNEFAAKKLETAKK
jgi:cytochrome c oxidase assembly factor CtaG